MLIETTSDLYMRRLVKEVRASFKHGVYYAPLDAAGGNHRVYAVKFSEGGVWVQWGFGKPWDEVADIDRFFDGYGRHICASREGR